MCWSYYSSDTRWWVEESVFRVAADHFANPPDDDDEEEHDEAPTKPPPLLSPVPPRVGERGLFAPALLVARPALTGFVPQLLPSPDCRW